MYLAQRIIYYHKVNFNLKRLNQAKIVKKKFMHNKKKYRLKKESIFVSISRITGKL